MKDRELVRACLAGDEDAWAELVTRRAPALAAACASWLRGRRAAFQRADIEEIVEEVFLEIVRDDYAVLRRFGPPYRLAPYLSAVARRKAADWMRRRKGTGPSRESLLDAEALEGLAWMERSDVAEFDAAEAVERMLASLPPAHGDVLRLRVIQGLSCRETAERLGMPVSTVTTVLSRARKALAEKLSHLT